MAAHPARRAGRPVPDHGRAASAWPTPRASAPSTSSSGPTARTRCVSLIRSYADGRTDDEAFDGGDRRSTSPRSTPPGWPTSARSAPPPRTAASAARSRAGRPGTGPVPAPGSRVRRRPARWRRRRRVDRRPRWPRAGVGRRRVLVVVGLVVLAAVVLVAARRRRRAGRDAVTRARPASGPSRPGRSTLGRRAARPRASSSRPNSPPRRRASATRPRSARRWSRRRASCRPSRRSSSSRSSTCATQIQRREGGGTGSARRWSATSTTSSRRRGSRPGLIPLTGTGIVLQLEDSLDPVAHGRQRGRLPRRGRATCARSSRSCGSAGAEAIAVNGERSRRPRRSSTSARRSSSTRPTSRRRTRSPPSGRTTCTAAWRPRPASSTSSGRGPRRYGIRVSFAEPETGRPAGLRRDGHPALRAPGPVGRRHRRHPPTVPGG